VAIINGQTEDALTHNADSILAESRVARVFALIDERPGAILVESAAHRATSCHAITNRFQIERRIRGIANQPVCAVYRHVARNIRNVGHRVRWGIGKGRRIICDIRNVGINHIQRGHDIMVRGGIFGHL